MPYLNKDEFMARIKERIGEDLSDDAVSFIEDASDTYDELIRRSSDTEDWKTKYEENDSQWRQKYRERFFTSGEEIKEEQEEKTATPPRKPVPATKKKVKNATQS